MKSIIFAPTSMVGLLRKDHGLRGKMEWIDIFLLLLLVIAARRGYRRGLWLSFARFIGLFAGLWLGVLFADQLTSALEWAPQSIAMQVLAFVCIFGLAFLFVRLLAKALKSVVYLTPFGLLDAWLGVLFSLLIWTTLLGLLLVFSDGFFGLATSPMTRTLQRLSEQLLSLLGSRFYDA